MSSKPKRFVAPPPRSPNLPEAPSLAELPEDWSAADLDRLTVDVARRIVSNPASSPRDRFLALEHLRELSQGGTREPSPSRLYEDDLPEEGDREGLLSELREAGLVLLDVHDP